ncbi:hypothetical protein JOC59_001772 [Weissella beninensis]|uniref:Uncharacterized protein n=1 Tax=Periweissella beninensis TaxID=504936 RepID=A0ABT0VET7_9LACO|nr:hypothetical protein [Periweissella beninensis]MBM7545030.1 hypothetical protein [Periweissella beninensis]MCM2436364.1 hypothetical protein [Periweissella beninensis]
MEIENFLDKEKLGKEFLAVKGYEEVRDRKTDELTAYKLKVSIQDLASPFYFEMFTIKVKNLNPTLTVAQLKTAKTTPITLENMQIGQFNGTLWFNCSDVLPKNK